MPASQTPKPRPELRRRVYRPINRERLFLSLYPRGRSDYRHIRRIRSRLPTDRDFDQRTESGMRLLIWAILLLFCVTVWAQLGHLAARLAQ